MKLFSLSRTQDYSFVGVFHFFFFPFLEICLGTWLKETLSSWRVQEPVETIRKIFHKSQTRTAGYHVPLSMDAHINIFKFISWVTRGLCFIRKYCKMLYSIVQLAWSWNRRLLMYHITCTISSVSSSRVGCSQEWYHDNVH